MMNENLASQMDALLERYASDEVMLGALAHWAANGTSMSAGYGLEENYPIIARALQVRHHLTSEEAQGRTNELHKICDDLVSGGVSSRGEIYSIYDIRNAITETLAKDERAGSFRNHLGQKVIQASLTARCTVALINWAISVGVERYRVDHLFDEPGTELRALLAAVLGLLPGSRVLSFSEVKEELIASGLINETHYRSAKGRTEMVRTVVPFTPALTLQEAVPRDAVPAPDVYVSALFDSKMLDQARTIEEIATSGYQGMPGMLDYGDYLRWEIVSAKGIVGYAEGYIGNTRHTVVAVSPLVREGLLQTLGQRKNQKIAASLSRFANVMRLLRDEMWPEAELRSLEERPDKQIWALDQVGVTRLFIYYSNWVSGSDLKLMRERGANPGYDSFIFALTDQSVPSVDRVVTGSLQMWQQSSVTLVYPSGTGMASHQVRGTAHPSLNRIMELLGATETTQPPQRSLVVALTLDLNQVLVGGEVTARAQVKDDKGNGVDADEASVSWGDGGESKATSDSEGACVATHTYSNGGMYNVAVTVSKSDFAPGRAQQQVTVIAASQPPKEDIIIVGDERSADTGLLGWSATDRKRVAVDMFVGLREHEERAHAISVFGIPSSGKSYTLGVLVEMAVNPQPPIRLGQPLAAVVFHYDDNPAYSPEFAKMIDPTSVGQDIDLLKQIGAQPKGTQDIVILTPPWRVEQRRSEFPGATVAGLTFAPEELGQTQWLLLMGVPGSDALYVEQVKKLLLEQNLANGLSIDDIRQAVAISGMSQSSIKLALQRLELASMWIGQGDGLGAWLKPGRLLILDIRDEMIDANDAMRLCLISLGLLQRVKGEGGGPMPKLIVLDEAHKYVKKEFASEIVTVVNQMRHTATTVVTASQSPDSIPSDVLEKSSIVMLHKLTAPKQIDYLKKAVQGLSKVDNQEVAQLKKGHAIVWATTSTDRRVSNTGLEVAVRPRYTRHV